jgi:hypothetical protein
MKMELKQNEKEKYEFCILEDLVELWAKKHYKRNAVVVLFNSSHAFDSIPMLNILKRDNFSIYMKGIESEFAFVKFDTPEKACDFVYGFDYKHTVKWIIYNNGELHIKSK